MHTTKTPDTKNVFVSGVLFIYRALSAQFTVFVAGQHKFAGFTFRRNQTQQLLFKSCIANRLIAGFLDRFCRIRPVTIFNAGTAGRRRAGRADTRIHRKSTFYRERPQRFAVGGFPCIGFAAAFAGGCPRHRRELAHHDLDIGAVLLILRRFADYNAFVLLRFRQSRRGEL